MDRFMGLVCVITHGKKNSSMDKYIGWRMYRYGPVVTKLISGIGSGTMLKWPICMVLSAQSPIKMASS